MEIKKIYIIDCIEDIEQNMKWFICDVLESSNCFTTKEEAQKECERRNNADDN